MKTCSIPNCGRKVDARGWCRMHYRRWQRNGDPTLTKVAPKGSLRVLLDRLMAEAGDDCVLWPKPDSRGYGHIGVNLATVPCHVIACEYGNGPRPPGMVAAHNCNVSLCVNPKHLRWATQKENIADQLRHGTRLWGERHYKAILTDAQILEAMELIASGVSVCAVARRFGVSRNAIRGRVETLGSRFAKGAEVVTVELIPREGAA